MAERQEMVVMHPDDVARIDRVLEMLSKALIDGVVAIPKGVIEIGELDSLVKDRPENLVREALLVGCMFMRGEVGGRIGDAVDHLAFGSGRIALGGVAIPAEPEAATIEEGIFQGDGEPACLRRALRIGDPI
jgi:hypothetical protein